MGRRVKEPVLDRPVDERVPAQLTRREIRLAESQKRGHAQRSTTGGGSAGGVVPRSRTNGSRANAPSSARKADPVYIRRGTRAAQKLSWKKRIGATVLIGGLAGGGLWVLGGPAAQAKVVSAGTLELAPGRSAAADSGLKFADGQATASFDIPGRATGGGLYVGLETRSGQGATYVSKARIWADGRVTIGLSKTVNGKEQRFGDVLTNVRVSGPTKLNLETSISGTSPVKLAIRTWLDGTTKPSWQQSIADATSTRVTETGSLRAWGYLSSGAASAISLPFSGLRQLAATPVEPGPVRPTDTPAPAPTTTKPKPTAPATTPVKPVPTTPTHKPVPTTTAPKPTEPSTGGKPGAGNTGVPSGTKLTVHNGDLVINKAGATYDSLDIRGFVSIQAPDVTIKRSIIRGGVATTSRGVINSTNAKVRNFLLVDSEIRPAHPSITLDGINGANFTLRRVEVAGGVDTVHIHGDNSRIEASWLHDTNYFSLGANGDGGPTHNDGVQVLGGNNTQIVGNLIEGANNAAIMVSQSSGATTKLAIKGNWLNDGGCTVNIVPKNLATIGPITLTDNVFGGTTRVNNCPVARTASTNLVASNNISAATGLAATINVWN